MRHHKLRGVYQLSKFPLTSASKEIVRGTSGWTTISLVTKPTLLTSNTTGRPAGTRNSKEPSVWEAAPTWVPFSKIVTPGKPVPVSSVTRPRTITNGRVYCAGWEGVATMPSVTCCRTGTGCGVWAWAAGANPKAATAAASHKRQEVTGTEVATSGRFSCSARNRPQLLPTEWPR